MVEPSNLSNCRSKDKAYLKLGFRRTKLVSNETAHTPRSSLGFPCKEAKRGPNDGRRNVTDERES